MVYWKASFICGFALLGHMANIALGQSPGEGRVEDGSSPLLAPFTRPTDSRPLPPPAPAPELRIPTESEEEGLEESFRQMQAKQVVVTASKREQSVADVPLTLSVIPAEELEGTGQFTLCDAVQYFPGLECRRGAMRKAAVSARGLGSNFLSNRLLLLNDGRPETDPWTGIFYPDETTPMTNLKQIEVIRGPGSALYGSNAFSGVINLIQRGPDDLMRGGRPYGVDFRVLGGQNNTYWLQTTAAGKVGDLKGLINYYGTTSDGPDVLSNPRLGIVDKNEGTTVNQVTSKVVYKGAGVDVGYTHSIIGRPGGMNITTVGNCGRCHYTPRDSEKIETFYLSGHADEKVGDRIRIYAEIYANFKRRLVELEDQVSHELRPVLGKRRRVGGEARALLNFEALSTTLGGDMKADEINNLNVLASAQGKTNQQIVGLFADGEYRPIPKLILGAGVRYDFYSMPTELWRNRTSEVSPRASLVYHLMRELTLRTNYGHAFRAPTPAELAINQTMYASTLVGNPYLKAEALDTIEAALDYWPVGDAVRFSTTGFYNKATNFINEELIFGSTSQFQNIGDARVVGVELEGAAQLPRLNTSFDVAYQYLDAIAEPLPGRRGGTLDYAPSHRIYFRAHKRFAMGAFADFYGLYVGERQDPGFEVNSMGMQTGRVILPAYLVANARVGAVIHQSFSLSLLAANLFNTKYEESLGFPAPGLSIFTEVKAVY